MNPHFAALGDVWKHLVLAELLRLHPPKHYWETHAGSASYPLTGSNTRNHGAVRFLAEAPSDPDLRNTAYLDVLRSMPDSYPGSPLLAISLLGNRADYVLCDLDPQSVASLRHATGDLHALVMQADGMATLKALAEREDVEPENVIVHIDPFEALERHAPAAPNAIELGGWLVNRGFRLVYWYGYDSVSERGWALRELRRLAPGKRFWCGDVLLPAQFVFPERHGAWGCGVVVGNSDRDHEVVLGRLGAGLERISMADVAERNNPEALRFSELQPGVLGAATPTEKSN
jgi:23S rRNA A2030 N6-methylase RlmJ